ncbi:MAG: hypothetical protein PHS48_10910 [Bacteroidales bacterium]|nr:hypothetical protein [Bacteroidales bacterium]
MRVYIKKPEFFDDVHTLIHNLYPEIPVAYLLADICRDELLVEIEGLAVYSG